jgi:hypothetical protein
MIAFLGILGLKMCSFSAQNISLHVLLPFKEDVEKFAGILMSLPVLFIFFIHLFICANLVWAPASCSLPNLLIPHLASRQKLFCLFSNFVEEKT